MQNFENHNVNYSKKKKKLSVQSQKLQRCKHYYLLFLCLINISGNPNISGRGGVLLTAVNVEGVHLSIYECS